MKVFRPREELRPYVRYYWTLESDEPFSALTFPIGCPQIIFHRESPLYIPELKQCQSRFTVSGQVDFPAHIQSAGTLDMIVAVFFPHTIGMFIDTPPSAFHNLEINGYDIANRSLNEAAAKIFDSKDGADSIAILEQWLMTKINPSLNLRRIENTLQILFRHPSVPVASLAEYACLSRKQYERVFNEQVGMNPKEYCRVVRFQKSLRMMQLGSNRYAAIAAECEYADQSHFIREFKVFSGHTPKTLLKHCIPYSDLFTDPALSEY